MGNNRHLRAFRADLPVTSTGTSENVPDDKSSAKEPPKLLGQSAMFRQTKDPRSETYQRITRLAPLQGRKIGQKRMGVIATGSAKAHELIMFDATAKEYPDTKEIVNRVELDAEANGLDLTVTPESATSVAWCTAHDIYEQSIVFKSGSKKAELVPARPRHVLSDPRTDERGVERQRSTNRDLRFLTPHHLLVLCNRPKRTGADLSVLHIYPTGPATRVSQHALPRHIKQATALDVCALDADSPGSRQFVIAVGAQDNSITLYTSDYNRLTDTLGSFKRYTSLRDVHEHPMTALALSPFYSPTRSKAPDEVSPHPLPQQIQLASVSVAHTVVVNTMPLSPLDPEDKNSRYVLRRPSRMTFDSVSKIAILSLLILGLAVLMQDYLTSRLGLTYRTSTNPLQSPIISQVSSSAHVASSSLEAAKVAIQSEASQIQTRISDTLRSFTLTNKHPNRAPLVFHNGKADSKSISVREVPNKEAYAKQDTSAKLWEHLDDAQKDKWRSALIDAGAWAKEEGETIFKGVFFSSYAGAVGSVVADALAG